MTFQAREAMNYRGEQRRIRALPLSNCGRSVPDFGMVSTGCWRGYQGTWEVRDDTLHLVRLDPPSGSEDSLSVMFPEQTGSVEATWFSGAIVPDDTTDPEDQFEVETRILNEYPIHFLWFTLLIHQGKLLLERTSELKDGTTQTRLTQHVNGLFPETEVAFMHAIHADGDDPTTKLVYADWLEERNDPRGLLLRGAVEQSKKEDPPRPWTEDSDRWDIPRGYVPPENLEWYWRRIVGIS